MQDVFITPPPPEQTPPSTTSVTSSCCSRLAASKVTFLVLGNLELLLATVALLGSLLFGFSEYIVVAISTVVAVLIILTLYFSLHVVNKNEAWVVSYNELAGEKESLEAKCRELGEENESVKSLHSRLEEKKKHSLSGKVTSFGSKVSKHF
ncbi:hypothetical protein CPE3_0280 [Chlamydia pecorum P787]|uniref:hypothetical protein n=1 Tax=Chlamydia pecorum TaxID=85991 RepID=UPI0003AE0D14|nr:hypothetical protein [Chlamydia pecorum]AGW39625.1 hypothetical protein CPE3_0280 [Chlamydia pecorum P787]